MPVPAGATLAIISQGHMANEKRALFTLTGTYTAADFEITPADGLGFDPVEARVLNVTDRTETYGVKGSDTGLKTIADGTRTAAAHGITFGSRNLGVDVSVAGPITDNDYVVIEVKG